MKAENLEGKRFGRLVVLYRDYSKNNSLKSKKPMWACKCDCGNVTIVRGSCLKNGETKSCGCLAKELMSKKKSKHGCNGTRLYAIWDSMRQRCNNQHNQAFKNYGERGISVCDEWNDFSVFAKWSYENGYRDDAERGEFTLDRIDVNGNYSPENCRYVSMKAQSINKRNTVYLTWNNETHSMVEWAEITGINYQTLWKRYVKYGWDTERTLTTA